MEFETGLDKVHSIYTFKKKKKNQKVITLSILLQEAFVEVFEKTDIERSIYT